MQSAAPWASLTAMAMTLPQALQDPDDDTAALRQLHRLLPRCRHYHASRRGRIDTGDSTGIRARDTDRFTAEDVRDQGVLCCSGGQEVLRASTPVL